MKKKARVSMLLGALLLIVGFVIAPIQAQAAVMGPEYPDWWATADAKVIFDGLPAPGTSGGGTAGGTAGYEYTYMTLSFPFPDEREDYLLVNLQNQEDPEKLKLFYVAAHVGQGLDYIVANIDEFVLITGYDSAGNPRGVDGFWADSSDGGSDSGWVWVEAWMFPQPDRETFLVEIFSEGAGFNVDYLELGTKCVVPIPPTLLLFGGGLLGILGLRRKIK